jgi:hypothetical protein
MMMISATSSESPSPLVDVAFQYVISTLSTSPRRLHAIGRRHQHQHEGGILLAIISRLGQHH